MEGQPLNPNIQSLCFNLKHLLLVPRMFLRIVLHASQQGGFPFGVASK